MISKKEIIEWLSTDYDKDEAIEMINSSIIQTIQTPVTVIVYSSGVRDIITKDENGHIIHLNPYETREN